MADAEEIKQKRADLKRAYGAAYARLSEILFHEDPIGINFDSGGLVAERSGARWPSNNTMQRTVRCAARR